MKPTLLTILILIASQANAQTYKTDAYAWALGNNIAQNIAANQRTASGNSTHSYTYTPPQVYNQPQTFYYPPYTYTVQPKKNVPQNYNSTPSLPTQYNPQASLPKYPNIAPLYIPN